MEYDEYGRTERERKPKKWLGGAVAVVIGLIVLLVGSVKYIGAKMRYAKYLPVVGVMVDEIYIHEPNSNFSATYAPVMEFTVNGITYRGTEEHASSTRYPMGMTVNMYYNPLNPTKISLNKKAPVGLFMIMIGVWSILGGIMAAVMSVYENEPLKSEHYCSYLAGLLFMFVPLGIFIILGAQWHPVDLLLGAFFLIGLYTFIQGIRLTFKYRREKRELEESGY